MSWEDGQPRDWLTYLEEQTGIKLSGSQVRRIIKQKSMFIYGLNIV